MAVIETVAKQSNPAKVLIVDDHPIVRYGVSKMISYESDMLVCGEACGDVDTLKAIRRMKPDIVLLDISLGSIDGLALLSVISAKYPKLPVLVHSMHDEDVYARKAMKSGARGYIMKVHTPDNLIMAIRNILDGDLYLSDAVKDDVIREFANCSRKTDEPVVDMLSNRERQVFMLMGAGLPSKIIAAKLALSRKTVDTHRSRIKVKLGIKSMTGLVHAAVKWVEKEGLTPGSTIA